MSVAVSRIMEVYHFLPCRHPFRPSWVLNVAAVDENPAGFRISSLPEILGMPRSVSHLILYAPTPEYLLPERATGIYCVSPWPGLGTEIAELPRSMFWLLESPVLDPEQFYSLIIWGSIVVATDLDSIYDVHGDSRVSEMNHRGWHVHVHVICHSLLLNKQRKDHVKSIYRVIMRNEV